MTKPTVDEGAAACVAKCFAGGVGCYKCDQ